jgi:hypothetical protein
LDWCQRRPRQRNSILFGEIEMRIKTHELTYWQKLPLATNE